MSNRWRWILLVGLSLTLIGLASLLRTYLRGPAPAMPPVGSLTSATLVNDTQPLPSFSLSRVGQAFTNADLKGQWTLMFFGYTYCPDVCPTGLTTVKELRSRLRAANADLPRVVFVSVDPARDTPERLQSFVGFFDPEFVGATANEAALAPLTKNLGVHYQKVEGADKSRYTMDHTAAFYLIDPQGRLKAVFSWPHDPAAMVTDYRKLTAPGA